MAHFPCFIKDKFYILEPQEASNNTSFLAGFLSYPSSLDRMTFNCLVMSSIVLVAPRAWTSSPLSVMATSRISSAVVFSLQIFFPSGDFASLSESLVLVFLLEP